MERLMFRYENVLYVVEFTPVENQYVHTASYEDVDFKILYDESHNEIRVYPLEKVIGGWLSEGSCIHKQNIK
jgi:hypothetical protein